MRDERGARVGSPLVEKAAEGAGAAAPRVDFDQLLLAHQHKVLLDCLREVARRTRLTVRAAVSVKPTQETRAQANTRAGACIGSQLRAPDTNNWLQLEHANMHRSAQSRRQVNKRRKAMTAGVDVYNARGWQALFLKGGGHRAQRVGEQRIAQVLELEHERVKRLLRAAAAARKWRSARPRRRRCKRRRLAETPRRLR
eukprot:4784019-Pleurochrysis_carterae.AAC.7